MGRLVTEAIAWAERHVEASAQIAAFENGHEVTEATARAYHRACEAQVAAEDRLEELGAFLLLVHVRFKKCLFSAVPHG